MVYCGQSRTVGTSAKTKRGVDRSLMRLNFHSKGIQKNAKISKRSSSN